MEQSIGLDVLADFGSQIQFKLGDGIENLVHLVGVLIEGHQAILNLHQIMALLENARKHSRGNKVLVTIHLFGSLDEGLPNLRVVNHLRHLQILLPLLNILDHDFLGGVNRESAGSAVRPGTGHAPGVDDVVLAGLGSGIMDGEAVGDLHGKGFILIHEAVRIATANGFQKVLSFR